MKPIFEQELKFLKDNGINIPEDCWRDGSKIYLTPYDDSPILILKVIDDKINIKKDNRDIFENNPMRMDDIINKERDRVLELEKQAIEFLRDFQSKNKDTKIALAYSGGKDSDVILNIAQKSNIKFMANFFNTSNESAQTYLHVKSSLKNVPHSFINPKEGYYQWLKRRNYFIPTALTRSCCKEYKEIPLVRFYDKNEPLINITGVRKHESTKRSGYQEVMDYDFYINLFGHSNTPKQWVTLAPIVNWTDLDIWVYLMLYNIGFNVQYRYGFERCGCLICPYESDYTDLLVKYYYPKIWDRWVNNILKNSFETSHVEQNYKYSFEEYINHNWKSGKSKEYEIIKLKPTPQRVKELSELKGISEELAKKYFQRRCAKCNKKLTPNDVGMNLKYFGREFSTENMLCKKCFCEKTGMNSKDYGKMVINFRESGCNLF